MAKYTCILFDLDNTLLNFDAVEQQALTDALREYNLPFDAAACEQYHSINRKMWDALAKGEISREKLLATRFGAFCKAMDTPEVDSKALNAYYEGQLATHADLMPGALEALEELGEVATLAIVSNGTPAVQQPRIENSGVDKYMDGIYVSEKVGVAKPSPRLLEHALQDLGVTVKERVLVVGDDPLSDIKGGLNAGLDTCMVDMTGRFELPQGIEPKYKIRSLEELYRIVMEPDELDNIGMKARRHQNDGLATE